MNSIEEAEPCPAEHMAWRSYQETKLMLQLKKPLKSVRRTRYNLPFYWIMSISGITESHDIEAFCYNVLHI